MKKQEDFKTIQEIRDAIDEIDFRILELFGDRHRCVEGIVNFKADKADVVAEERQKEMLALRQKWAVDFGLNPEMIENIFKTIIKYNIKKQLSLLESQKEI
jgi:isochorismate pyruvate lyase